MDTGITFAWSEQHAWSLVANRLKARLQIGRRLALTLAVLGAALSTTAAGIGLGSPAGRIFAFVSGACLGLTAIVQQTTGPKAVQRWTRARSASEAIKSEVYRTLAGVGRTDLDAEIERINNDVTDLRIHRRPSPVPPRPLPQINNIETYVAGRVTEQIDNYYSRRVRELNRSVLRFRIVEIGLAVIGVLVAVAAGTWELDGLAVWLPVITTIGAAVAAHAAAERYSYLLVEYSRTADELSRIRDRRGRAANLTDAELVTLAEKVISTENQGWMAKFTDTDRV